MLETSSSSESPIQSFPLVVASPSSWPHAAMPSRVRLNGSSSWLMPPVSMVLAPP
jgi:hypothetical protein